jgi:outer membrane protein assembly factor BamB
MRDTFFSRPARRIGLLLMVMVFSVGCSQRMGVGWATMSLATDADDIMVVYQSNVALVSRTNGFMVTQDLQGTTNIRGASGVWSLNGGDVGSEFYAAPLYYDYGNDRIMVIADYNGRIFTVNFGMNCFATPAGACGQNTPIVELPSGVLADMAEDDQRIYVPMREGGVMALNKGLYEAGWDMDDATERRTRFDETFSTAWLFETERGVWAAPVVLDGYVYISSMDHYLYKVDAETGEEVARLDLGGALASSVLVYDGTPATDFNAMGSASGDEIDLDNAHLYVGTFNRRVYRIPLDFQTGSESELDYFSTEGWVWGAPRIVDGVLYATDLSGNAYAVDIREGGFEELWQVDARIGGIRAAPLVTENHVIVAGRDGKVKWLRREDGSTLTEQDVRGEVLSEILFVPGDANREDLIIVSTVNNSRIMVAFTLDGAPRWTYPSS